MHPPKPRKPRLDGVGRRAPFKRESPSSTFSYYAKRPDESRPNLDRRQSGKLPSKPVKSNRLRFSFWVFLIIIVACIVKVIYLSSDPRIEIVDQTKLSKIYTHSPSDYATATAKLLSGGIANHFKITADTSGIEARLKSQFPELAQVSITYPIIGNKPIVYLSPAQPSLILVSNVGQRFAVNHSGFALAPLGVSVPDGIPVVTDDSGADIRVGKRVLPSSTIEFIEAVAYQFKAAKQPLGGIILPKDLPYELDVQITGRSYIVKFNLQADATEQVGRLLASIESMGSSMPSSYIDVRVPGRVYYK
ncbi:MAG: hypothetical protein ABI220_00890 [Candidatus Saccharimonadales bacterium]